MRQNAVKSCKNVSIKLNIITVKGSSSYAEDKKVALKFNGHIKPVISSQKP